MRSDVDSFLKKSSLTIFASFCLLFFTGIIADKHRVKIVPKTKDKKYVLNRLFSMNQNIYKRNTDFNLN